MNTNNIKRYAPKARNAFISAMTKQAAKYGITSKGIEPLEQKGDLALIGDRPFPASMIRPRAALVKKVEQMGFAQAMEQAAYSWFNRLCAIRFMEIKGYLDHGRRVLSHPEREGSFQILDDCLDIELEGLDRQRIKELKLDGTKDEELYRELLLTQCHALHQAMPFLFEAIDDATELLLPDNLTKTDSLIRELVSAIPEDDWQEVEIIGWLYQFYISEKKEEVIGKVVKSEDIPAATQLFTPNWIVQYLVQNSLGRQWLQTYPDSPLKAKMTYYIEPAEQTPEVQAQLAAITPDSIDPLTIKVLDPACGSGHILVEAYKVLKEIYTERGFRSRDIPQLILENNLFGLDIDDRAGQLAGFALMMLAREDDRRIFNRMAENGFKLNVLSLQESSHLDVASLWKAINITSDSQRGQSQSLFDSDQIDLSAAPADNRYLLLKATLARFTEAKTFGSLIEVPADDAAPLGELLEQLRQLTKDGDSIQKPAAEQLIPFVQQASMLAQRYDAVVANPPYMGSKYFCSSLSNYIQQNYRAASPDIYACFILAALNLSRPAGFISNINIPGWMMNSTFENFRIELFRRSSIVNLIDNGRGVFGSDFGSCAFVIMNYPIPEFRGKYRRLFEKQSTVTSNEQLAAKFSTAEEYLASPSDFQSIRAAPMSYYVSHRVRESYRNLPPISNVATACQGLSTSNDNEFVRFWHEVSIKKSSWHMPDSVDSVKSKWIPYNKGGIYRKWYGNIEHVINWENNGCEIKGRKPASVIRNEKFYFKESISWQDYTIGASSFRLYPEGFVFATNAHSAFSNNQETTYKTLGFCNSTVLSKLSAAVSPGIHFNSGYFALVPFSPELVPSTVVQISKRAIEIAKQDWDNYERSWNFPSSPLVTLSQLASEKCQLIVSSFESWVSSNRNLTLEMKQLEEDNNNIFSSQYHLNNEQVSSVCIDDITLTINPAYRYGEKLSTDELLYRFQDDSVKELVSYSIGCMMGRYSLDTPGLVYAHAGNQGFAELVTEGTYETFPADSDGILPLTGQEWFADDATNRFREFVHTVWGEDHLQENLDFVAESLCLYAIKPKRGESALDCIRRYLSTQFYKDHLKTYKKRPIYWLFSSGKHKAFECLVYLHRYHEGTLARMRTEYVIPLTAKLNTYANKLEQDIEASTSTAEKKRLEKELDALHKQQAELATFDEKLRHFADQRISLDLDDGVKVNYGKFGDLLAEVKAITGEKSE